MKKRKYESLLVYIAEEKAYLKFQETGTLDINNPVVKEYIRLEVNNLRDVFEMYECVPRESYVKSLINKMKQADKIVYGIIFIITLKVSCYYGSLH